MNFTQLISGARPRTLALGLSPVWIGAAAAWRIVEDRSHTLSTCTWITGESNCNPSSARMWTLTILCLGVALLLQIAANFANDYSDGIRGTDAHRVAYDAVLHTHGVSRGESAEGEEVLNYEELHAPSRLVASGVSPRSVLTAAGVNAVLACVCGVAITFLTGYWWFIIVGILCVLAGWFYVGGKNPYGYRGWGELSAFVFFGPVATLGTTYAISGAISWSAVLSSILIGCVALAVLSVNNLRDIDSDRIANKRTWVVRLGSTTSTACIVVLVSVVMAATCVGICMLGINNGSLAHQTLGMSFCAILGTVCVLLFGSFTIWDVIRREYMHAMKNLSLLAISFSIAYMGLVMTL